MIFIPYYTIVSSILYSSSSVVMIVELSSRFSSRMWFGYQIDWLAEGSGYRSGTQTMGGLHLSQSQLQL
jgi:hypothetical protein